MLRGLLFALCASALLIPQTSQAAAVFATYTVSGSTGDWTLDFTIGSNLDEPTDFNVYTWGVLLPPGSSQTGTPPWNSIGPLDFVSPPLGFSPAGFYHSWFDSSSVGFANPGSLSGFQVHLTVDDVPATFSAYAAAAVAGGGGDYLGAFDFSSTRNPGFLLTAVNADAVPEPSTFALLGTAFAGIGLSRLRRKKS